MDDTLEIRNIRKRYGDKIVLKGVDLSVKKGEVVGLLGPNGAGKTTLFYIITGIIKSDSGEILYEKQNIISFPMYKRAKIGIGYLPQENSIFKGMNVEDNIMSILEIIESDKTKRAKRLIELLEEFSIEHIRKSSATTLSGGERRRVEISRVIAQNPSFILLDEPFAGIDPIAVNDIMDMIRYLKNKNIGILITDHNVRETLKIVDKAYIVFDGTILSSGSPDDIKRDENVKRVYLGNCEI